MMIVFLFVSQTMTSACLKVGEHAISEITSSSTQNNLQRDQRKHDMDIALAIGFLQICLLYFKTLNQRKMTIEKEQPSWFSEINTREKKSSTTYACGKF